jgi:hypothetical protein
MTAAAMLSRKGRRRGVCDNDDGEEEVVEVDDSDETVTASGGGGRQKGGFKESLRRTARPTAPTGRMGAMTMKSTKTCCPPPRHRIVGNSGVDCRDDDGGRGGGGDGGIENDDRGRDGDHNDDVCPSSSCSYRPSFSLVDPPATSLPSVAGGGGRAARGGDGNDQDNVAVLPRWRLDAGNTNAHSANAVAGGVVIDKLNPSLIFTSTRSEHSDSPWCEPITPPSLFARGGAEPPLLGICV